MNDVKWIKLYTDMFDNSKIRQLRALAGGNEIVLVWVMLLVLAGKCNAGGMIMLMEHVPYTIPMLATELGFTETQISMAINALISFGMITDEGDRLSITNWEEYQNASKLEEMKEYERLRKREYRRKKAIPAKEENVPEMSRTTSQECPSFCSYSFSISLSNLDNYKNLLSIESKYKYKDYINKNKRLYKAIEDWMVYKDEKRPKKQNHYDTKMGLEKLLTGIVKKDQELGTDLVAAVIDESIAKEWMGITWDVAERLRWKIKHPKKEISTQPEVDLLESKYKALCAEYGYCDENGSVYTFEAIDNIDRFPDDIQAWMRKRYKVPS